jgi:type IV fimbrial biogenesis protein FimT
VAMFDARYIRFSRFSSIDAGRVSRRQCHGYTLHDVLVTMAIVGATTTSMASLHGIVQDHQRTAGVNDLLATLSLARSAAITRGVEAVLCPSRDNMNCASASNGQTLWHEGMMLYVNEDNDGDHDRNEPVVRTYTPDAGKVRIKSSPHRSKIVYQPSGLSPGSTVTFTVCAGAKPAKYVVVSNSGRARVSTLPGDGRIDEIHEMCP